jgi:hypothetical protein
MMAQFAIRNVEHDSILDFRPIGVMRQKNKFSLAIDKIFDRPRASNTVYLNFFASDPLHYLDCLSLCQKLQPNVTHRGCVSGNVSSAGEEQVEMLAQLPATANVERYV